MSFLQNCSYEFIIKVAIIKFVKERTSLCNSKTFEINRFLLDR